MTQNTYPHVQQFETRDRELVSDKRLLTEQRPVGRPATNRLQRLVALTLARVGGR
jgi:hypothetical protein